MNLDFLQKTVGLTAEKKIQEMTENFSEDNIIIIRLPELKAADFKKKYVGVKNNNVGLIRLYTMNRKNMVDELLSLSSNLNYKIDSNCINFIADLYEGNMVSASQALLKLDLLNDGRQEINLQFLQNVFQATLISKLVI